MSRTHLQSTLFRCFSLAIVAGGLSLLASSASAVNVTNYSWLQLPSNSVTPIQGSTNNTTGAAFGELVDVRWGDYVWLPSFAMTNFGGQMYYAGVQLDQARPISDVRLQWWTSGMSLSRYFIDASNDGSSWSNIATQVGATPATYSVNTVPVTPGNYQYVRVRFEPGDYTSVGYGGPGLMLIDPIGSGTVTSDKANWANTPNFGTSVTNSLGASIYTGTAYGDGTLEERGGTTYWTGTPGNWGAGLYTEIDLGADRLVSSAIAVWNDSYWGDDFDIQYSTDGTNFFNVANPTAATNFSPTHNAAATKVGFDPVIASHIRMLNASRTTTPSFVLMNQLLLHGPTDGVLATDPPANDTISTPFRTLGETITLNGAIELENIGTLGSSIAIFSYAITGPDALQFDLTNFAPTILASGNSVLFNLEFMSLASQNYNAVLTFNTSLGDVVFNLQANMVPEPSTLSLFGLGIVGMAVRSRRRRRVVK